MAGIDDLHNLNDDNYIDKHIKNAKISSKSAFEEIFKTLDDITNALLGQQVQVNTKYSDDGLLWGIIDNHITFEVNGIRPKQGDIICFDLSLPANVLDWDRELALNNKKTITGYITKQDDSGDFWWAVFDIEEPKDQIEYAEKLPESTKRTEMEVIDLLSDPPWHIKSDDIKSDDTIEIKQGNKIVKLQKPFNKFPKNIINYINFLNE